MNILNINSYFLSSTVHLTLQEGLMENLNVNIKTFVPISEQYKIREECKQNYSEDIIISECFKNMDRFFFNHKNNKIYNKMMKIYNFDEFDIVHAHSLFTNGLVARKVNLKFKKPYIVTVRDTDVNVFFKYFPHLRKIGRDIILNADKVIFLSSPYYNKVKNEYLNKSELKILEEKSIIIPNPLDDFWFENLYTSRKEINDVIKLLYVGTIEKRKNLLNVTRAIKDLNDNGYNIKLTIVGSSKNKKIENTIKKYSFVSCLPRVDKSKLLRIYREHDIFIMASTTESFGLVYGEAMTQGLPVIYTKDQGFDGNFDEGEVGYSVISNSVDNIGKGIIDTIHSYNKITENISKKSQKFKKENIIKAYDNVFNN